MKVVASFQFPDSRLLISELATGNWKLETGNWQLFPEEDER
jgi:hypothetical protein